MLRRCSKCLLITTDAELEAKFKELAVACDIQLTSVSEWKPIYRIQYDTVICDSDKLEMVGEDFYEAVIIILKEGENFIPYSNRVNRFIFNKHEERELLYAFVKPEVKQIYASDTDLHDILSLSPTSRFYKGNYDFDFQSSTFYYKDKSIYLSEKEQCYLANWLLKGRKDNNKRQTLYLLRRRFSKDFLADVDRLGKMIEEE